MPAFGRGTMGARSGSVPPRERCPSIGLLALAPSESAPRARSFSVPARAPAGPPQKPALHALAVALDPLAPWEHANSAALDAGGPANFAFADPQTDHVTKALFAAADSARCAVLAAGAPLLAAGRGGGGGAVGARVLHWERIAAFAHIAAPIAIMGHVAGNLGRLRFLLTAGREEEDALVLLRVLGDVRRALALAGGAVAHICGWVVRSVLVALPPLLRAGSAPCVDCGRRVVSPEGGCGTCLAAAARRGAPPPPPRPPLTACAHCGGASEKEGSLNACGGCWSVAYCEERCRLAHWKAHAKACASAKLSRCAFCRADLARGGIACPCGKAVRTRPRQPPPRARTERLTPSLSLSLSRARAPSAGVLRRVVPRKRVAVACSRLQGQGGQETTTVLSRGGGVRGGGQGPPP